jgi:polyisoprenyl-phosphate glycosyltransferase
MKFSLVIPVYNEEKIIPSLIEESVKGLESFTGDFEIICVDDGSRDRTLEMLLQEKAKDARVKVLMLSRNFGHQAAYTAGLSFAKGDYIAMMDGDLQDPPALLKDMYSKLVNEDFDVVFGYRKERREAPIKKLLIKSFHQIFTRLSNINAPANVGNFSVMNRKALTAFLALQEKNRYLPGLRFFIGFKQGFVEYDRPDRTIGDAKMNFTKLLKLGLDAIFSFSKIPIRLCLIVGITGISFTLIGVLIVVIKKITGVAITGWSSILLSIYFLGSVQLLFLGVIGEYVHRIFVETQNRPIFIVKNYFE